MRKAKARTSPSANTNAKAGVGMAAIGIIVFLLATSYPSTFGILSLSSIPRPATQTIFGGNVYDAYITPTPYLAPTEITCVSYASALAYAASGPDGRIVADSTCGPLTSGGTTTSTTVTQTQTGSQAPLFDLTIAFEGSLSGQPTQTFYSEASFIAAVENIPSGNLYSVGIYSGAGFSYTCGGETAFPGVAITCTELGTIAAYSQTATTTSTVINGGTTSIIVNNGTTTTTVNNGVTTTTTGSTAIQTTGVSTTVITTSTVISSTRTILSTETLTSTSGMGNVKVSALGNIGQLIGLAMALLGGFVLTKRR